MNNGTWLNLTERKIVYMKRNSRLQVAPHIWNRRVIVWPPRGVWNAQETIKQQHTIAGLVSSSPASSSLVSVVSKARTSWFVKVYWKVTISIQ